MKAYDLYESILGSNCKSECFSKLSEGWTDLKQYAVVF